jgi:uncharacterized protein
MVTRRGFLSGAAAFSLGGSLARPAFADTAPIALMSAARIGVHDGGVLWRDNKFVPFALPGRGHALAHHAASNNVVLVGRRPGAFAAIVNASDPQSLRIFSPAKNCHFAGHAVIAPDAASMITSEFNAETTRGVLVVRDCTDGRERAHWSPEGIEPHELLFAGNGSRVVVALGGLIKDGGVAGPAFNDGGIDSAVAEIDPRSGKILHRYKLSAAFATLSLRHMAMAPDEKRIAIGMQDQDQDLSIPRPLAGVLRLGEEIELLPMPDASACDFRGYIGSIAFDKAGDFIAATSPRGGVVGLWSMRTRTWLGGLALPDACGLAPGITPGEFWATSGYGDIVNLEATQHGLAVKAKWRVAASFDNHVLRL